MGYISIKIAAISYQKLFNYEYSFTIVRNRNTPPIDIHLRFSKDTFHHLCGLHKLKDIEAVRREKREIVFDKIIKGIYPESMFQKSKFYNEILDRIDCLIRLEEILDDKNTVFKFNSSADKSSKIEADYLVKNESDGQRYYFMLSQDKKNDYYFGRSCFARNKNQRDYSLGHTSYTMLRKIKINLLTDEEPSELFIAPTYKKQLDALSTSI